MKAPGKRVFDVVVAGLLLLMLWPVLAGVALLVWGRLGRPILFRQTRPGKGERPFTLLKFRTMSEAREATGALRPDGERLPSFGAWLRRTSLDELPELWNVLRGDMSLVGPRPLLMEYLPRYTKRQRVRHAVRPGLTGWAQVHGRNAVDWPTRLELDAWYVENRTFFRDLQILVRTVGLVLSRRGVSQEGHATMPPFEGRREP